MTTLTIERLSDSVGARVTGVDEDRLAGDDTLAASILDALEANGVLVFPGLYLSAEAQVAFSAKLGPVDYSFTRHPVRGIYVVSLDAAKNATADYLHSTFYWHIDGSTPEGDEYPQMATMLNALAVAPSGGETEFASTYAAYDALSDDEKRHFASLRVMHSLEASQRLSHPDPSEELVAQWRRRPTHEHPLVWTHRSGRKSLVIGASADYVVGMDLEEGRALLNDLLDRATAPDRVYQHTWSVGDTVIWDNRGVLHRALRYAADSPREMLRTTILGDEPIQ